MSNTSNAVLNENVQNYPAEHESMIENLFMDIYNEIIDDMLKLIED